MNTASQLSPRAMVQPSGDPPIMVSRVVLVHPGSEPGGTQVYLKGLAAGARARGIEVVEVGDLRQLRSALKGRQDALVHAVGCLPSAVVFASMAMARLQRLPMVWTPIFHPSRPRTYGRSLPHLVMRVFDLIAPRVARFAGAVIALTEEEQAYFRRLTGRAVDLVPCGTDGVGAPAGPEVGVEFRRRHGLADGPIILVLGRSSPRHKGLSFCLDAFGELRVAVPDAQLVLVGGLGEGTQIDGVHALGWVTAEDRDAALASATVVFVPSAYEALSIAVIEAWAVGAPVVATDRVALAALVERAGAGWVVPFDASGVAASTLATALFDDEARTIAAARGRVLIEERFRTETFVENTLGVYERVVRRAV